MKKIYNILLFAFALFAIQPIVKAADPGDPPYKEENHIAYSKTVTGPVNGIYTIHLDTFVTGEKTVTETGTPADIVLVLDVSGSMDKNLPAGSQSTSYTALESQDYSYDSYGNNTYYYLHTDGQYYPVYRYRNGGVWSSSASYYLVVYINGGYYYLSGTGITGSVPTSVTNSNSTIWTGVLYSQENIRTKMDALKAAVKDFVKVVQNNALYDSKGNPRKETDKVHHQIAIVKFGMDHYYGGVASTNVGNHFCNQYGTSEGYYSDYNRYNCTEVVAGFTDVVNGTTPLTTAVEGLRAAGATSADYGMNLAKLLITNLGNDRAESNKTVVFFTDGAPTHESGFVTSVADDAISYSKSLKDAGATVFSVGVFGNLESGVSMDDIETFMKYISSDFPTAVAMDDDGDGAGEVQGYYQDATQADLSSIFRDIANASGGSEAQQVTAEATTTVDVVSQSFQLPEGATGDIHVYFANCSGIDDDGYLTFDEANKIPNPGEGDPMHVKITVEGDKITASDFDYTGHWCGVDETVETGVHGMKLMIEIPIEMADDAVGGVGVGTNGPGSGIFIDGKPLIYFEEPHVSLPTNLHIKKEGMGPGECATFEIFRKKLDPKEGDSSDWETTPFKTVIVICGLNDNTVKLMGLDPHYLYKIVEKVNWNWAYDFDHIKDADGTVISQTNEVTSDKLITNPFIFVNTTNDKNASIRHAESAVSNDFRNEGEQKGISSKNPPQNATSDMK